LILESLNKDQNKSANKFGAMVTKALASAKADLLGGGREALTPANGSFAYALA
jgi:hypothetical protein